MTRFEQKKDIKFPELNIDDQKQVNQKSVQKNKMLVIPYQTQKYDTPK